MSVIIGFSHTARAGKDLSGDYLQQVYQFQKESFAKALKEGIGQGVFGLTPEQIEITKEVVDPYWNMSPRQILQKAGTEFGRVVFGEDIWIKTLKRRIDRMPTYNYAITDVRYKNEAEAIKKWGGIVVRIDRSIAGTNSQHISEIDLKDWNGFDAVIDNNGTKEQLYHQLDLLVSKYLLHVEEPVTEVIAIKVDNTPKAEA